MKTRLVGCVAVVIGIVLFSSAAHAGSKAPRPTARVFVQADSGFDLVLTSALQKKHVPVSLVNDKDQADFEVGGTHSAYEADVKLVDLTNGDVVFTYSAWDKSEHAAERAAADVAANHVRNIVVRHKSWKRSKIVEFLKNDPAFDF
jgi:hypothetical protein